MIKNTNSRNRVRLVVEGKVQGVFFRANTKKMALSLGLKGFVKNLATGSVEIIAEGEATKVEELISWCRKGNPPAEVDRLLIYEAPSDTFYDSFRIEHND